MRVPTTIRTVDRTESPLRQHHSAWVNVATQIKVSSQIMFGCWLCCLIIGCGTAEEPAAPAEVPAAGEAVESAYPPAAPAGQTEEPAPPESAESEVSLEIKSWEETQELVKQAPGKIVVMDLWATYCAPCLVEFPNLVELHKKHGDQVTCISVSLDYQGFEDEPVESYREAVMAVLKRNGATFQNILCSTDADTIYNEKIKQGSIPVVYVFDKQGHLAAEFPNPEDPAEFTYQEDVLPLVAKLLEQE